MTPPLPVKKLRPFIPSKDFAVSRKFYLAMGFEITWEDTSMCIFRLGDFEFFLQDYYHEGWAKNCMLNLVVADVQAWKEHLRSTNVATFENVKVSDIANGEHGAILHLIDPAGVLWHIQQLPDA